MATPVKWGAEFAINTTLLNRQSDSSIAALANGRFVVTWTDNSLLGPDTTGDAVRAQIFNADGTVFGAEFQVNSTKDGDQSWSTVTTLASGRFVVTWQDASQSSGDVSLAAIRAQTYNADGTRFGGEVVLNSTTNNAQATPAIAALTGGGYAAVWTDSSFAGTDISGSAIRGRVIGTGGLAVDFQINTTALNDQSAPTVTGLADGRFVVSWVCDSASGGDIFGSAIRAQIVNADGSLSGSEFLVNITTADDQDQPNITALANGFFVITWTNHTGADSNIKAQVYASNGLPTGGEISVNTTNTAAQTEPVVTALADGRFIVVWTDASATGDDTSGTAIRAQLFRPTGTASGTEFVVNTTTIGDAARPAVTELADGRLLITWDDTGLSTSSATGDNLLGQIFDPREAAIDLTGKGSDDAFYGTGFDDTLAGVAGKDTLTGGGGSDILTGGLASDRLAGGSGDDLLAGETGNDVLRGGLGRDTLSGGVGSDRFLFNSAAEAGNGLGRDTITDFQSGADHIVLSAFMADGSFIGSAGFTPGAGPQVRYNPANGLLQGDANGDGTLDFSILLQGAPPIAAGDFIF